MAISAQVKTQLSRSLSEQIAAVIPGGVDSPFRSFQEVGGHTIFFNKGAGAYLFDVDGNKYIDYLGAWGPSVLGYCQPLVVAACKKAIELGAVFGAPHVLELELATELIKLYPSMEKVRFVNSGTEAVMSAVRLARGATGRDLIIMFEGCYHGHSDSVLASQDHKASSGIPQAVAANTVRVPFNNLPVLEQALERNKDKVAAVLIEPVAGSMGVIPPQPGYLEGVRKLCSQAGCLLIFDEVLTGLRVARGGAQELYRVKPDITCFGKALGGGMPIGAYGGPSRIMDELQPLGEVYQAGTFSGNPVTMAGGVETLSLLANPAVYTRMEALTARLFAGLQAVITRLSLPVQLQRSGSMFAILFAPKPIVNFQDSLSIDAKLFAKFFHYLLDHGVYLPPSAVDAAALSSAHTEDDIDRTIAIAAEALATF